MGVDVQRAISNQLKNYSKPTQRFSVQGTQKTINHNINLIEQSSQWGSHEYRRGLLDGFAEIDHMLGSAACEWQWLHTRLAVTALLHKKYRKRLLSRNNVYFVTTANPRHECKLGDLQSISLKKLLRKSEDYDRAEAQQDQGYLSLTIPEINLKVPLNGERKFQPHIHKLVTGTTKEQLRAGFEYRPNGAVEGSRSTMIMEIDSPEDLLRTMIYLTKACPELKNEYQDSDGNRASSRNPMSGDERAEWAAWFGQYDIEEVVRTLGISSKLRSRLFKIQMERLVPKFLHICRKTPSENN